MIDLDEAIQMLSDCEARESKLTDWERGFIQSIAERIEHGITQKQYETLEKIWERIT